MDDTVDELVKAVTDIVSRSDATITIRDSDGRFLWANSLWQSAFNRNLSQIQGKTLTEIGVSTASEVAESDATDEVLRIKHSVVESVSYGQSTKIVVIRTLLHYKDAYFRVTIAYNTNGTTVPTPSGWSPERADRALGAIIANRLRLLESSSQLGVQL
jgi:transcriptional regulator with PAS, ATPase and Fis domain